ncbi:DNA polymerase III chi subunit [Palleronia aestuarii]|uniref:DNA polymerase III chi subunit n=1 Tax=Palleronia aestuarii TaxID=568105 RepID=A0A2W7P236_9RHOB|nr:DNA polymerase III subunit chi [Palleronia aestuarii]PZX17502.1 DNA polymerase III chi subunit [Palleronia aestuarii]
MGAAYFYHLTRRPLEAVLPTLLEKARGAGWRIVVRGANPRRMEQLDAALWTYDEASFLPHGLSGGDADEAQPILLTTAGDLPQDVACLMCVDGAEVAPDEVHRLDRVCVIFDGDDPAALEKARAQWRSLTRAQVPAQYWSEEAGRWEKKAEA